MTMIFKLIQSKKAKKKLDKLIYWIWILIQLTKKRIIKRKMKIQNRSMKRYNHKKTKKYKEIWKEKKNNKNKRD